MPQTITAVASDILKVGYEGPVRDELNNDLRLLSKIGKKTDTYVGSKAHIPLSVQRNRGHGARGEDGTLSTPGKQGFSHAEITAKLLFGRFSISDPVIEASRNDRGAFIRLLEAEMKGLRKDLKKDVNRQCFGDGTGVLAYGLPGAAGTTTTTMKCQGRGALEVGQIVNVAHNNSGTGVVKAEGVVIQSISVVTANPEHVLVTFTTADIPDAQDPDGWCIYLGEDDSDGNAVRTVANWANAQEIWGIRAMVSKNNPAAGAHVGATATASIQGVTEKFGGIDRTDANSWWRGNAFDGSSTTITEHEELLLLMQEAMDSTDIALGREVGLIVMDHQTRRRYMKAMIEKQRFVNTMSTDAGQTNVTFDDVEILVDSDCKVPYTGGMQRVTGDGENPANVMYFLNLDTFENHVMTDWSWMDRDGAVLHRIANKPQYEATMKSYFQLFCDAPAANAYIMDIPTVGNLLT